MLTIFRTSSGSLFQSSDGAWRSLLIKTGARPLARNSSAKLVARTLFDSTSAPCQYPPELVLLVDQFLGAEPIPVVLAEEPNARESAGAFQAVEIVEFPLLAAAEILTDLEVAGQPVDPGLEVAVDSSFSAVLDRLALEKLLALEPAEPRDDQAGDPRAGHARGRVVRIGSIGPTAVVLLASLPVGARQFPDGRFHGNTRLAGGVQTEKCVLRIRIVTGPGALRRRSTSMSPARAADRPA